MNRHDDTELPAQDLTTRVDALIERSSLGESAPRRLRARTGYDRLERINTILRQRATTTSRETPIEALASSLFTEQAAATRLPKRTPGRRVPTPRNSKARPLLTYPDPAYHGPHRNDSHTMTRVVDGLRQLTTC